MFHKLLMPILALFIFSGCGYQWGNRHELLPGNYREIAVPIFRNKTQEVGSEVYFTNAMIEEIARAGNSILPQDKADIVLEGVINLIQVDGEGLANVKSLPEYVELISSYKIHVEVTIKVRKKSDSSILFNERFTGKRTFASAQIGDIKSNSANPNYNHSALHENLRMLSQDLMTKAYNLMTESL